VITASASRAGAPPVRAPVVSSPRTATPELPARPGRAGPDPGDGLPMIDRATLERTRLHRGPARGPVTAPVTIVVFNDMTCHFCGKALGTIDQLVEEYPGKLRLVMKQLPVHRNAVLAAEASYAADAQGKFWEMHDLMMAHQEDLSRERLLALAQQAGLDVATFRTALDRHAYKPAVEADEAAAAELDIRATPAFVINGQRVIGALPVDQFRKIVDQALANL
jgi:protein-disulfide isomerase